MKSTVKLQPVPHVGNVIMKLAFLGGMTIGAMYVFVLLFARITQSF
ncbi:MAG: hypothetical protein K2P88_04930 [Chitinophagaceae bacterium]|nr:hypothetical protein [Chitinophagaceae bacterium]